jgi:hypothetical protein
VRFPFSFDLLHRSVALPLGIMPATAYVDVEDDRLDARFGLWRLSTPLSNVKGTEVTGPYNPLKTMGPAHLSLVDHGLTFATNSARGLCICFREPVPGIEPTGRLRHPGLTVTVADVEGLAASLETISR